MAGEISLSGRMRHEICGAEEGVAGTKIAALSETETNRSL